MSRLVCRSYCAPYPILGASRWGSVLQLLVLIAIAAGAIIGLVLGILRTVEQEIKLLTIVLSIYELPWENSPAVLEVFILVCTSDLQRGTLSKWRSDTPILGSGHMRLYPLDTVPTGTQLRSIINTKCASIIKILEDMILCF